MISKIYVGDPWDQQPGEKSTYYGHFQAYLRFRPPRDPAEVAKNIGKRRTYVMALISRYRWIDRANVWDARQARLRSTAALARTVRTAEEQITAIEKVLKLGMSRIDDMISHNEMPLLKDSLKMIFEGTRLIKELREEAANTIALEKDQLEKASRMDYTLLTDDEVAEFIRLLNKGNGTLRVCPSGQKN